MTPVLYEQTVSFLGLIGLWAIWYYVWKPQRVDVLRQELFALRGNLFDLAANGTVPFNHPAYMQLRLLINGMLRFAHRVTFPALIVAGTQSQGAPSGAMKAWRNSVNELPEGARTQLLAIHENIFELFAKHVIGGSITLWLYLGFRVAFSIVRGSFLFLLGRKSLSNFTVDHARLKVDIEGSQITKAGAQVIEARVLSDEQRRVNVESNHAYAQ